MTVLTNSAPIVQTVLKLIQRHGPMGWYRIGRLASVTHQAQHLDDPDHVTSKVFSALQWCSKQGYVTPFVDAGTNSVYGLTDEGRGLLTDQAAKLDDDSS